MHGVGEALAARLAVLGVRQARDLLFVLPIRYEDRTRAIPIGSLRAGQRAVVEGEVLLADVAYRGRRQLLVRLSDGSGTLTLRFFYFSNSQREALARGVRLRCFGEARRGPLGLEFVHPEYRRLGDPPEPLPQTLTPVYPTTEGITQTRLRGLIQRAFALLEQQPLDDLLQDDAPVPDPDWTLVASLRFLHQPPLGTDLAELAAGRHPAQRRLAFEELLAHQLSLLELRRRTRRERAVPLTDPVGLQKRLLQRFPFALTGAQARVSAEIDRDLAASVPMSRLIQGDVGCGKTAVAALAAARALGSGAQVALMAPTELLAEQHAHSFAHWFAPLGVEVLQLIGSQRAAARRAVLAQLASPVPCLVVGTHALFQQDVTFGALGLVIVDEQHRFGVQQRMALRHKGQAHDLLPHQLIMTATPIPRTLAMTAYADLDVSVIDELPPGRVPVRTVVIPEERRAEVVARIVEACGNGRQVYWVCALIEESEELHYRAAEESAAALAEALPALRIGLVHGRMPPAAKEAAMHAFASNQIQLLVATTVIEVGVDVPNATVVVIENAERMGLAQLHQLRGRTGRGAHDSSCVLLYRGPLSEMARARLGVIRESTDGFFIAQRDLELRGPGELLGTRQAGLAQLRVADLVRDADLLPEVRACATRLLERHPERVAPLIERWIGHGEQYARVALGLRAPRQLRMLADYLRLMRIDKPIGIALLLWPTLWALWAAAGGVPPTRLLFIFIAGTIVMRSAGCAVNDLIDRNIDPHVHRTRHRPLAARRISPYGAIVLVVLLLAAALALAVQLNAAALRLAVVGAGLTLTYPFCKRFLPVPQLYLGLCFGWGVPMAFAAVQGSVPRAGWLLLAAAVVWAGVYDTFYAMVDRDDDRRIGVRSSAISFGDADLLMIGVMQVMVLLALALAGRILALGAAFYLSLAAGALLFVWQQWRASARDRASCLAAFRHNNYFGLVVLLGVAAAYASQ